jgi:hypothetical protein
MPLGRHANRSESHRSGPSRYEHVSSHHFSMSAPRERVHTCHFYELMCHVHVPVILIRRKRGPSNVFKTYTSGFGLYIMYKSISVHAEISDSIIPWTKVFAKIWRNFWDLQYRSLLRYVHICVHIIINQSLRWRERLHLLPFNRNRILARLLVY